jgi:hypothetical protein
VSRAREIPGWPGALRARRAAIRLGHPAGCDKVILVPAAGCRAVTAEHPAAGREAWPRVRRIASVRAARSLAGRAATPCLPIGAAGLVAIWQAVTTGPAVTTRPVTTGPVVATRLIVTRGIRAVTACPVAIGRPVRGVAHRGVEGGAFVVGIHAGVHGATSAGKLIPGRAIVANAPGVVIRRAALIEAIVGIPVMARLAAAPRRLAAEMPTRAATTLAAAGVIARAVRPSLSRSRHSSASRDTYRAGCPRKARPCFHAGLRLSFRDRFQEWQGRTDGAHVASLRQACWSVPQGCRGEVRHLRQHRRIGTSCCDASRHERGVQQELHAVHLIVWRGPDGGLHRGMENRKPLRAVFYCPLTTGRAFALPALAGIRIGFLLQVPALQRARDGIRVSFKYSFEQPERLRQLAIGITAR